MNVIIVGCGFLGKAAAQLFSQQQKINVFAVVLSNESREKLILEQQSGLFHFDVAACDVTSQQSVDLLTHKIPENALLIYAVSSGGGGSSSYASIYRDGLKRIMAGWKPEKVIFVSSTSVYGQTSGEEVTELSLANPQRETSRLLLEAEEIALEKNGIVTRFSGIYGPGRSVLLKKFLTGNAILEEGGHRYINQIHRDDGARALLHLACLKNASGIYNVTDSTPSTQQDIYGWIASYLKKPVPPNGPADFNRKRGWTSKRVSNKKLQNIGWKPDFPSYREALEELVKAESRE
jgi:nucleoside-diphosphate-sugar epimerase